MKSLRCCLILILLGLSSAAALADTVDPKGKLGGGGGSTGLFLPDPSSQYTVFGGSHSVEKDFINATGMVATEVDLLITLLPNTRDLTFFCDPSNPYLTDCNPLSPGTTLSQGGTLLIRFFGLNSDTGHNGIPTDPNPSCDGVNSCFIRPGGVPAADFAVIFADASTTNQDLFNLPSTEGFLVKVTLLVPEPSTILLVLVGGVLLLLQTILKISVLRLGS